MPLEAAMAAAMGFDGAAAGALFSFAEVFLSDFSPPDDAIAAAIGFDGGRAGASWFGVFFSDPIPPEEEIAAAIGCPREEDGPFFSDSIPPDMLMADAIGLAGRRPGGGAACEFSLGISPFKTDF